MNERQLIEEATAERIKQLCKVFFEAYTNAMGDVAGQQRAETTFRNGVLHTRYLRERAIANLPT